jgi:nitronate monooxygenase
MDGTKIGAAALPQIIQGGMGIGVSGWPLARAVSQRGQLGVVSGAAIDTVLARRLQDGDPSGHVRRAMARFPIPGVSEAALSRYYRPGGRGGAPYASVPLYPARPSEAREALAILASFVEVHLAKDGHDGPVGLNLLAKLQLQNLPLLYGAMLAGVDYVLMGAGIPLEIPGILDRLARHEAVSMKLDLENAPRGEKRDVLFDPSVHLPADRPPLKRPRFLPIISASSLATMLVRRATGPVDGFVIEGPTAGGHNAPPRGSARMNARGEPVYGERDAVDLDRIAELGLPFWLAGGEGSPEHLCRALDRGAAGIQVGTLFAFCRESGLDDDLRRRVLDDVRGRQSGVLTDPAASPTGFPFKVVQLSGSLSDRERYQARPRICDVGLLRTPYLDARGHIAYRCAAEPTETFVKKGGRAEDSVGRKCLCNALLANIGQGQVREGEATERPLLTAGEDLNVLDAFVGTRDDYGVADVIDYLLAGASPAASVSAR